MGFLEDAGKALLESAANSFQKVQQEQARQNQMAMMQEFAAREGEFINAANRGDLQAIRNLAAGYYKQEDFENAAQWASKGARVDDTTCLLILGTIACKMNDHQTAEQLFLRNVSVNGDDSSAMGLVEIYLAHDNYDQAEHFARFVFRRDNTNSYAAFCIAFCMLNNESNDFNQIKQLLQIAVRSSDYNVREVSQQLLDSVNERERNQQNQNCFITTAVCDNFGKPDDCYELTAFRKFRDGWLKMQSDGQKLIEEYYKTAPSIVAKINSLPNAKIIYSEIWDNYLSKCLSYIESRDYTACKKLYVKMVENLKAKLNV